MRRLVLVVLILCMNAVFAAATVNAAVPSAPLDKLENALFGFTYPNETESLRLERLETEVYGKTGSGAANQRLAKLNTDLSAGSIGKEIPPKEDTFADEPKTAAKTPAAYQKEAANIDYPAINALEQMVFNKESKEKPLDARLAALEQKTFQKTFPSDNLNTRVERLRADLTPTKTASKETKYDYDDVGLPQNYNVYQPPTYSGSPSAPKANLSASLNAIEKSMFKRAYTQDNLDSRLARIENGMFGATFDNDSEHERLNRIGSAFNAQKSASKYDSNKFSQMMGSGMQIGMFLLMVLACIL